MSAASGTAAGKSDAAPVEYRLVPRNVGCITALIVLCAIALTPLWVITTMHVFGPGASAPALAAGTVIMSGPVFVAVLLLQVTRRRSHVALTRDSVIYRRMSGAVTVIPRAAIARVVEVGVGADEGNAGIELVGTSDKSLLKLNADLWGMDALLEFAGRLDAGFLPDQI